MNRALRFTLLGLAVVVVLSAGTSITSSPDASIGSLSAASTGVIAFVRTDCEYYPAAHRGVQRASDETCYDDIWSANVDGGRPRLLTRGELEGHEPTWSPNGLRIGFASVCDIWSMKAGGSDLRRLVPAGGNCYEMPAWSPRGTKIAYSDYDIFTVNANGKGRHRLTRGKRGYHPAWSPNGRLIAFRNDRTGALLIMNTDGSGLRLIARGEEYPGSPPAWSPDSRQIAFDGAGSALWVVNIDGSALREVAPRGAEPSWSPDGRKIAYTHSGEGKSKLMTMNPDGSGKRLLGVGEEPTWSPDGTRIAYSEGEGGTGAIHLINANGTGKRTVVNDGHSPVWQPKP
jgi:TolB protein